MSFNMRQKPAFEVWASLRVSMRSEAAILETLIEKCGIAPNKLHKDLHLTVYHGRRRLAGLIEGDRTALVTADTATSRFMVMAPGGENPHPDIDPRRRSVGIRFNKRNQATKQIQELRASVYRLETEETVRGRTPTDAKRNAFGARHFQPHVTLIKRGGTVDRDLTKLGTIFRAELQEIEFDLFRIEVRDNRSSNARTYV